MNTLYNTGIALYVAVIRLAALFSPKAALWVDGRRHWRTRYAALLGAKHARRLWVHAASLGEFEQGRPLMEAFRKRHPDWQIILSFFSPSGYEIRKNYPHADVVVYLPADTPANARDFVALLKPDAAVFVKYEFWANHLFALKKQNVPVVLISALFRPSQPFFKPWGGFWRRMLSCFSQIFVQNEASGALLQSIGFTRTTKAGDTRVDRVIELAAQASPNPVAAAFAEGKKWVVVGGSVWPPDEALLAVQDQATYALLLAPHEADNATVQNTENTFKQAGWRTIRYSQADPETVGQYNVLIIDNVGLLNTLYRYGFAAYIGGGFGKGIHNTLEPAAWGLPVLFGPKYTKFEEACRFVETGGAFKVNDAASLAERLNLLTLHDHRRRASEAVQTYLRQNQGATNAVLGWLHQNTSF